MHSIQQWAHVSSGFDHSLGTVTYQWGSKFLVVKVLHFVFLSVHLLQCLTQNMYHFSLNKGKKDRQKSKVYAFWLFRVWFLFGGGSDGKERGEVRRRFRIPQAMFAKLLFLFSEEILISLTGYMNEESGSYKSTAVNFKSQILKGSLRTFSHEVTQPH